MAENWKVTRYCCTSGMCEECRAVTRHGRRIRVVHIENISKDMAQTIAKNWAKYDAVAVRQTELEQVNG